MLQGPAPSAHLPVVAFSVAHANHMYCAFQQPTNIQLQDCTSGSIVKTIPVAASGGITALAVGPSDKLLAVGTASGTLLLMRGATEAWSELAGHGGPVQALAFSRCGTKLYSMAGKTVFVWDIKA
jgi:WD40 repeat protein